MGFGLRRAQMERSKMMNLVSPRGEAIWCAGLVEQVMT